MVPCKKDNLDKHTKTVTEQMPGVFSDCLLMPAPAAAGDLTAARSQHGDEFFHSGDNTGRFAFHGENGDLWQIWTVTMTAAEGGSRVGKRISPNVKDNFILFALLILASMLLVACAPSTTGAQASETVTPIAEATTIINAKDPPQDLPTLEPGITLTAIAFNPTATVELTATQEPTATLTPTVVPTQAVEVDFEMPDAYQQFEAQWPLDRIVQTDGHILRCAVDTADFQYGEVPLPGGLVMKSWTKCYFTTSNGRIDYVNIPIYVEDAKKDKNYLTFAVEPGNLPGSGFLIPALKKSMEERWLPIVLGTPELGVRVVGASFDPDPSQQITPGQQFFDKVYDGIDMSAVPSFATSGDTSKLPKVGVIDHFLVIDALNFDIN